MAIDNTIHQLTFLVEQHSFQPVKSNGDFNFGDASDFFGEDNVF